jgi:beta-lactamase regulating signal transducer with metallopeptidase domain
MILIAMTMTAVMQDSTNLLAQVAEPALRALALAAAAGLGLKVFRVKATAVRLFTWTAVLYGALAMPLLGWILPPLAVPAPGFVVSPAAASGAEPRGEGSGPIAALKALRHPKSSLQRDSSLESKSSPDFSSLNLNSSLDTRSSTGARSPLAPTSPSDKKSSVSGVAASDKVSRAGAKAQDEASGFIAPLEALRHPKSWTQWDLKFAAQRDLSEWSAGAAWIYLAVALVLLARVMVGIEFSRRLLRAAQRVDDPRATRRLASRAYDAGLTFIPEAAESDLVSVPVTLGTLRSTILLPLEWREWDDAKLDAVIAHEMAHVARRDGLTQRLSLVHRAIFWFSPLAWWLDRKLAELAEQASDEAALSGGADCNEYARTLLGFFEALQAAPGRVWWQGVAMAKAGISERQTERLVEERLERILSWKGSLAMGAKNMSKKWIAVAVLVFAVPAVYVAASARPSGASSNSQAASPAQSQTPASAPSPASAPTPANNAKPSAAVVLSAETAPESDPEIAEAPEAAPQSAPEAEPPMPPAIASGISGGISGGLSAPLAPVAPPAAGITAYSSDSRMAPLAPWPPAAPQAYSYSYGHGQSNGYGQSSDRSVYNYSSNGSSSYGGTDGNSFYRYSYDNDERWIIVSGKSDSLTMSGDMGDAHHVEKLKKQIAGDFIWFQRGDKSYVIRDQATIDRARKLWTPPGELDKKQEALAAQQEALGKQQEELGSKMEQVQVKVPDMTADLDKLKAELKALSSSATIEDVGRVQSEIGDLQSKIGELQIQADGQQSKVGEQQGALGEKQGRLGREQAELGRQQARLAREANRQMKLLLDEAVKKGVAQLEL